MVTMRKALRRTWSRNVVARLGDVQHEIERRLPVLADVGAGVALRVVEQAVTRADHGLPVGLPGKATRGPMAL